MFGSLSLLILITWPEHSKLDTKGAWPLISDPVNAVIVVVTNTGSEDWRINHSRDPERGRNSSLSSDSPLSETHSSFLAHLVNLALTRGHSQVVIKENVYFFYSEELCSISHFRQWYIYNTRLKEFLIISKVCSKISGSRYHITNYQWLESVVEVEMFETKHIIFDNWWYINDQFL